MDQIKTFDKDYNFVILFWKRVQNFIQELFDNQVPAIT